MSLSLFILFHICTYYLSRSILILSHHLRLIFQVNSRTSALYARFSNVFSADPTASCNSSPSHPPWLSLHNSVGRMQIAEILIKFPRLIHTALFIDRLVVTSLIKNSALFMTCNFSSIFTVPWHLWLQCAKQIHSISLHHIFYVSQKLSSRFQNPHPDLSSQHNAKHLAK